VPKCIPLGRSFRSSELPTNGMFQNLGKSVEKSGRRREQGTPFTPAAKSTAQPTVARIRDIKRIIDSRTLFAFFQSGLEFLKFGF